MRRNKYELPPTNVPPAVLSGKAVTSPEREKSLDGGVSDLKGTDTPSVECTVHTDVTACGALILPMTINFAPGLNFRTMLVVESCTLLL